MFKNVYQGESLDADDHDLYVALVELIQKCNSSNDRVSLREAGLSVTLAAVLAVFCVAPQVSPGGECEADGADREAKPMSSDLETPSEILENLMELWSMLCAHAPHQPVGVDVGDMQGLQMYIRRMLSASRAESHDTSTDKSVMEQCGRYLFLAAILRRIPRVASESATKRQLTPLALRKKAGKCFSEMQVAQLSITNRAMLGVLTTKSSGRITQGDLVRSMEPGPVRTGMVTRDDSSRNPYVVVWDDTGVESGWLVPSQIEKMPQKSQLAGKFEGSNVTFTLTSETHGNIEGAVMHHVGNLVIEDDCVSIIGTRGADEIQAGSKNLIIEGSSRYNSDYFCDARLEVIKNQRVLVHYEVHGDLSLGPLQDARGSRLYVNAELQDAVEDTRT